MGLLDQLPPATRLRCGGVTLNARRLGSGPRLVLLHGGPGLDHHLVLPLAPALAKRFEVVAPDLPGHGRSPARGEGLPDLAQLTEATARWLAALDPPPAVLVGHSLGAWVALELMRTRRVDPRAAVLIAPPVPGRDPAPANGRGSTGDAPRPSRPPWSLRAARRRERLLRACLAEFCAEGCTGELSDDMQQAISRAALRAPELYTGLRGQLRALLLRPLQRHEPACPVLLATGESDRICPPGALQHLAAALPGARSTLVRGAGHVPWAAGAGALAGAIDGFLSGCLPPPDAPAARG